MNLTLDYAFLQKYNFSRRFSSFNKKCQFRLAMRIVIKGNTFCKSVRHLCYQNKIFWFIKTTGFFEYSRRVFVKQNHIILIAYLLSLKCRLYSSQIHRKLTGVVNVSTKCIDAYITPVNNWYVGTWVPSFMFQCNNVRWVCILKKEINVTSDWNKNVLVNKLQKL